jgi:hypothetical protein
MLKYISFLHKAILQYDVFRDNKQRRTLLLHSQQRLSNKQTAMAGGRCACEEKWVLLVYNHFINSVFVKNRAMAKIEADTCSSDKWRTKFSLLLSAASHTAKRTVVLWL